MAGYVSIQYLWTDPSSVAKLFSAVVQLQQLGLLILVHYLFFNLSKQNAHDVQRLREDIALGEALEVTREGRNDCVIVREYSETSLIRHSMGPENNVGLGGCWIMECLLPYLYMVTVPHIYNGRIRKNVGL